MNVLNYVENKKDPVHLALFKRLMLAIFELVASAGRVIAFTIAIVSVVNLWWLCVHHTSPQLIVHNPYWFWLGGTLCMAVFVGGYSLFTLDDDTCGWIIMGYCFAPTILPVAMAVAVIKLAIAAAKWLRRCLAKPVPKPQPQPAAA